MKLGLVSAILGDLDFENMIQCAAQNGYKCVEVACWPKGTADRRYAGVTHIDVDDLSDVKAAQILEICKKHDVEISALAYYPNAMDADLAQRELAISHIKKVLRAAKKLSVNTVGTFIGRDKSKNVEENLKLFQKIWKPIIEEAEAQQVRIAIENCPMLFTADEWPGGKNLAVSPKIWKQMFEMIPSEYFGLNYDPSHFIWQKMDYIQPLYEFKEKIFHIHFKDIKVYQEKLNQVGILAAPLSFMAPKLPGYGDIDWELFCTALKRTGYDGPACVEVEDRAFEDSFESVVRSLEICQKYMSGILDQIA